MFKTISAAVLAISVLAAPAMAANVTKSEKAPVAKTEKAPVAKHVTLKRSFANANAKMTGKKHHRHHRAHRHGGNKAAFTHN